MIFEFEGKRPQIGQEVFIAPTAVIIGDVTIGDGSSIWFGAVLRGDEGKIIIGRNSNVQDNAVLHATVELPTLIADEVTIGHGALLEGCNVESGVVIGMGAIVLEGVKIEREAMVAAGGVVTPGTIVPSRMLVAGAPAKVKKKMTDALLQASKDSSSIYCKLNPIYRTQELDKS